MASLNDLSPKAQILVFLGLAIGLVIAGEMLYLSSYSDQNSQQRLQLKKLQVQNDMLRPYLRKTELLKQSNATLQRQLDTLLTMVPKDPQVEAFIGELRTQAQVSSIHVRTLEAQPKVQHKLYVAYPYRAQIDGSFADMAQFFNALAHQERIVQVSDLQMSHAKPGGGGGFQYAPNTTVTANCVLTTFASQERATPAKGKPGPAGRRPA